MIEVWFFDTPYIDLIRMCDYRGILLKAHINWLRQSITHCGLRVNLADLDLFYQATWLRLKTFDTTSLIYKPCHIVDVSYLNQCTILDRIDWLFRYAFDEEITLTNVLHMMYGHPERVNGMLCTSFILEALCLPVKPDLLYPDNLYKFLSGK